MDRLRYNQLKAFVQLDYKGRHDDIPQFNFHREDLKWLFEMAEKAESYERSLRTIAQDMNGKESTQLIEMASKALRN